MKKISNFDEKLSFNASFIYDEEYIVLSQGEELFCRAKCDIGYTLGDFASFDFGSLRNELSSIKNSDYHDRDRNLINIRSQLQVNCGTFKTADFRDNTRRFETNSRNIFLLYYYNSLYNSLVFCSDPSKADFDSLICCIDELKSMQSKVNESLEQNKNIIPCDENTCYSGKFTISQDHGSRFDWFEPDCFSDYWNMLMSFYTRNAISFSTCLCCERLFPLKKGYKAKYCNRPLNNDLLQTCRSAGKSVHYREAISSDSCKKAFVQFYNRYYRWQRENKISYSVYSKWLIEAQDMRDICSEHGLDDLFSEWLSNYHKFITNETDYSGLQRWLDQFQTDNKVKWMD